MMSASISRTRHLVPPFLQGLSGDADPQAALAPIYWRLLNF